MTAPKSADGQDNVDLSGRTLADFRLLRKLGQGGMGQVYLAEQVSLGRKVALKILRAELASSSQAMARFETEAKNVARATHANIVQVYTYGVTDGMPYMALEYVEGRNLRDFLAKKGPPDLLIAISIMRQVASALSRAGELGVIHRDIKPENILLTRKGEVKVADFGLSRCMEAEQPALNLTATGVTMGTPLYMSPEQVEGKTVDVRTDIYSFGVTCYHMLAGHPPFQGSTAFEVALQHVQKQAVPLSKIRPDLPEMLSAVVQKMMAKDPAQRYQTARELQRDVARLRDGLSGQTQALGGGGPTVPNSEPTVGLDHGNLLTLTPLPDQTESPAKPVPSPRRRLVWMLVLFGLSFLLAIGAGAAWAWWERAQQQALPDPEPNDPPGSEIILANKQEHTLREMAEQYLSPGKLANQPGGLGVCMDLGLFYLDNRKVEEADKLFTRLEAHDRPAEYKMLGQFGRGITLALKNEPQESNKKFKTLFPTPAFLPPKFDKDKMRPKQPGLEKAVEAKLVPLKPAMENPRWRYWLANARWYNNQNGLPETEVPLYLKSKIQLRPPEEPKK